MIKEVPKGISIGGTKLWAYMCNLQCQSWMKVSDNSLYQFSARMAILWWISTIKMLHIIRISNKKKSNHHNNRELYCKLLYKTSQSNFPHRKSWMKIVIPPLMMRRLNRKKKQDLLSTVHMMLRYSFRGNSSSWKIWWNRCKETLNVLGEWSDACEKY